MQLQLHVRMCARMRTAAVQRNAQRCNQVIAGSIPFEKEGSHQTTPTTRMRAQGAPTSIGGAGMLRRAMTAAEAAAATDPSSVTSSTAL